VVAPQADGQAVASQSFPDELHPDPGPKVQIDVSPGLDQASEPMFLGSVVAVDGYLDIAVVKITGTLSGAIVDQSQLNDLTQVTLGDSGNAQSGDPVLAVGYPVAAQSPIATFTTGVVSGFIPDARIGSNLAKLNTSAEISGGNSGGVLADSAGQLIGVTTWGLPDDNGQIALSSARPIDLAKAVISAAENGKHYVSPYVTPAPAGATVQRVDQVGAGDNGTVTSGCSSAGNGSGSFALGMQYKGFSPGKQTDVMAALYATNSDGSETQVAVANDFDDSDYPTTLPTSGCATLTFDWLAQPTAGTYTLRIGVGGDLKVIYKGQITVS
jgi:S1-C subfamily serine protease